MEDFELIQLTECELEAVAGGNPFSINLSALSSTIIASITSTLQNNSANAQENSIDNSIHVTGP